MHQVLCWSRFESEHGLFLPRNRVVPRTFFLSTVRVGQSFVSLFVDILFGRLWLEISLPLVAENHSSPPLTII